MYLESMTVLSSFKNQSRSQSPRYQRWGGQQGPLRGNDPPDLRSKTGSLRILASVS